MEDVLCIANNYRGLGDDGAFVYYMQGETAAKTPFDCICKIQNQNMFESMVMRKIAYEKMGGEVR